PKIQVFATDIDEDSLDTARAGRYADSIALDVSPERLRRYFTKVDHHYTVRKELREMVLFAPHNILHDPPFSRQDLLICRNLLIYLNHATQEKVFETFHFSLRPNGMLFLGASESAESMPSLFSPINKKYRIYQWRPSIGRHVIPATPFIPRQIDKTFAQDTPQSGESSFAELHSKFIERFDSPSVLVDENYDILHTNGNAAPYLQFASGDPTRNLLKFVLPCMKPDLLAALLSARDEHIQTEANNIQVDEGHGRRFINIRVQPIESPAAPRGFFLVTFREIKEEDIPSGVLKTGPKIGEGDVAETVISRLEEELHQTKNRLLLTIEEEETAVEELRASNEELQSINEELRSTTEELETGREELQSINEELTTVNHELKDNVDEVSRGAADLSNLMASTDIGTIFLDRALNIKLYTPPAQQLFNIIASDVGRPLEHITHKLDYDTLNEDANEVLRSLQIIEREARTENDRWYAVRLMPYRAAEDGIEGVVITFVDVTKIKNGEIELARMHEEQSRFFEAS
ncbi:MAG: CheR family methyltransferase, partial [Abditibacteriaceae bacterium]